MDERKKLVGWLGKHILPLEPEVRGWLKRALGKPADVEDVLQEAYCRLCFVEGFEGIANPRAYFFRMVRNIVVDEIRRARVVKIEALAEIDDLHFATEDADPERATSARRELRRVQLLIQGLPPRCRQVFELRKIHGLSQRDVAVKMRVSEHVVENETARGLKLILKAIEEDEGEGRNPKKAVRKARYEQLNDQ